MPTRLSKAFNRKGLLSARTAHTRQRASMLAGCCTGHGFDHPQTGCEERVLRLLAATAHADKTPVLTRIHAQSWQSCRVVRHHPSPPVFRSSRVHRSCTGGGTSAGPARSSASSCCSAKASSDSSAPPLSGSCCKQADKYQACSPHTPSAGSAQIVVPAPQPPPMAQYRRQAVHCTFP